MPQTAPKLTNVVTDWIDLLAQAIDNAGSCWVPENCTFGISNHHAARWMGLTAEAIFKALDKNNNTNLTDEAVASYAAHQFITSNFLNFQSSKTDALLNVYWGYNKGAYQWRQQIDDLVLPVVRHILEREATGGIANFVQRYVAPSTIGVDAATLKKYEGQYQCTPPGQAAKVPVTAKGQTVWINWQERAQFGTIRPFFGPLVDYVQGLAPPVLGTPQYDHDLRESQAYGSNQANSKSKYGWGTPLFWLENWGHFPAVWSLILRSHIANNTSIKETARIYAALGEGIFEACNANYGMKWGGLTNTTALWRPITAIRSGDTFGHTSVADWTPELDTPEHPEFPSGHCAHSGAAAEILRLALGNDKINVVIETDYNEYNPTCAPLPNRHFTTLSGIEQDIKQARINGGIHYGSSCDAAHVLAHKAAQSAWAHWHGLPDPVRPGK